MDSTTTLIGFAMAALAGYFAIMNPISNTATFIGITSGDDPTTKKAVGDRNLLLHTIERTTHAESESRMRTAV